jgi:hypothetical protein
MRLLVVVLDTSLSMLQMVSDGVTYADTARSFLELVVPKVTADQLALFTGANL